MDYPVLNSIDEMLEFLKNKNIDLNYYSPEKASNFLKDNNYFFKLYSYRKNFEQEGEKYINLNFNKLVDLSTIDMLLRYLIMEMSLDIEHRIKTIFVNEIIFKNLDNGYHFLKEFISDNKNPTKLKSKIFKMVKRTNESLYSKNEENMPLWVVIECCDFGMLESIIRYYLKKYPDSELGFLKVNKNNNDNKIFLSYVRNLRNRSAHNSVLLNSITTLSQEKFKGQINRFIKKFLNKNRKHYKSFKKNARIKTVHDLTTLFLIYDKLIPDGPMKKHRYKEIKKTIIRSCKLKNQYRKDLPIQNTFKYFFALYKYIS